MNEPIQFLRSGVTVFTSALYQTTSTLLETPDAVFLIDPNWLPFEVYRIKDYVESVQGGRKLYLIFTHSDYDHIIGYGAFPGARVIASAKFASKKNKSEDVDKALAFDHKFYMTRDYPVIYPPVDIEIDQDGKSMHFAGTVLTFYQAPGHTAEGLFIVFEPAGVFVAGDYLSDVEPPLIEDDIKKYRRTMSKVDRILSLHQIQYLIPGHGSCALSAGEIVARKNAAIEYLDDIEKAGDFPLYKYLRRYGFREGLLDIHNTNLAALGRHVT